MNLVEFFKKQKQQFLSEGVNFREFGGDAVRNRNVLTNAFTGANAGIRIENALIDDKAPIPYWGDAYCSYPFFSITGYSTEYSIRAQHGKERGFAKDMLGREIDRHPEYMEVVENSPSSFKWDDVVWYPNSTLFSIGSKSGYQGAAYYQQLFVADKPSNVFAYLGKENAIQQIIDIDPTNNSIKYENKVVAKTVVSATNTSVKHSNNRKYKFLHRLTMSDLAKLIHKDDFIMYLCGYDVSSGEPKAITANTIWSSYIRTRMQPYTHVDGYVSKTEEQGDIKSTNRVPQNEGNGLDMLMSILNNSDKSMVTPGAVKFYNLIKKYSKEEFIDLFRLPNINSIETTDIDLITKIRMATQTMKLVAMILNAYRQEDLVELCAKYMFPVPISKMCYYSVSCPTKINGANRIAVYNKINGMTESFEKLYNMDYDDIFEAISKKKTSKSKEKNSANTSSSANSETTEIYSYNAEAEEEENDEDIEPVENISNDNSGSTIGNDITNITIDNADANEINNNDIIVDNPVNTVIDDTSNMENNVNVSDIVSVRNSDILKGSSLAEKIISMCTSYAKLGGTPSKVYISTVKREEDTMMNNNRSITLHKGGKRMFMRVFDNNGSFESFEGGLVSKIDISKITSEEGELDYTPLFKQFKKYLHKNAIKVLPYIRIGGYVVSFKYNPNIELAASKNGATEAFDLLKEYATNSRPIDDVGVFSLLWIKDGGSGFIMDGYDIPLTYYKQDGLPLPDIFAENANMCNFLRNEVKSYFKYHPTDIWGNLADSMDRLRDKRTFEKNIKEDK